jgi:hypothetical protein
MNTLGTSSRSEVNASRVAVGAEDRLAVVHAGPAGGDGGSLPAGGVDHDEVAGAVGVEAGGRQPGAVGAPAEAGELDIPGDAG